MAKCNLCLPFPWLSGKCFAGHEIWTHRRERDVVWLWCSSSSLQAWESWVVFAGMWSGIFLVSASVWKGLSCMTAGWAVWLAMLGKGLLSRHCLEPIVPERCRLSPNACSMPRTNWRVRNSLSHATGLCCYLLPGDDCLKIILVMTRHCGSAWGGSKYLEDWEYLNIGVEYKAYILLFISDFTLLNCLNTWNYYVDMI